MFRWLAVLIVLAGGTFALMATLLPRWEGMQPENPPPHAKTDKPAVPAESGGPVEQPATRPQQASGSVTDWETQPLGPPRVFPRQKSGSLDQPIIIPNCTLTASQQQEVPCEKEGKVLFIGTEVKDGEIVPPEDQLPPQWFAYLVVEAEPDYKGPFVAVRDPKTKRIIENPKYRRWKDREIVEPGKVIVVVEWRPVRKLREGMWVSAGDLVALVNPEVAYSELQVGLAELDQAYAERLAAGKAREATGDRYRHYVKANNEHPGAISGEDFNKAKMEYEKAIEDEKKGEATIRVAQSKLNKAATTLKMYEIHAEISGRVKSLNKSVQGEAVKPLDPVLVIQNDTRLRVEGTLDLQEALKLKDGMKVEIDSSRPEPPRAVLSGHRGAVTCVAIAGGNKPVIVSGSEDLTLRGWDVATGQEVWELELYSVPRAVACSPDGKRVLFGDSAGVVRLLDLEKLDQPPQEMKERHDGAVLSVAFRPDGKVCASAGVDRALCLWDTESRELAYRLGQAHRDYVTAVQFAGADSIVTAGRDNKLEFWDVSDIKAPRRVMPGIPKNRSGDVAFPGVSPDGKLVLSDQGRDLVLLSRDSLRKEGVLTNPDAQNFAGLALFSPDGKTILTHSAGSGRLQLWRAPSATTRAAEIRQFIWNTGLPNCAAFAPQGGYAVSGTQDNQVVIWTLPSAQEVQTKLEAKLSLVERALETRNNKVRVRAELDNPKDSENPNGWLISGAQATIVVPPQPAPTPGR